MPNENESPEKADPNSEKPMEDIDEEPMALLHANLHPDEMLPSSGWVLVPVIGTIQSDGKLVLKDGWKDFVRFEADPERQPAQPRIPDQDGAGG